MSSRLDPDQARNFHRLDLRPICLQRLSAAVTDVIRSDKKDLPFMVLCLFRTVPWVDLWFVIVAFTGHTRLLLSQNAFQKI